MKCGGWSWIDKAVDHFALGQQDFADIDGETELFRHDLHRNVAGADLAGERVVAAVAALGGVAERQQKTFVAAHQLLQTRAEREQG